VGLGPQAQFDVSVTFTAAGAAPQVLEYRDPGAPKLAGKYPLDAQPVARSPFSDERPQQSLLDPLPRPTTLSRRNSRWRIPTRMA
jgi:hypothetical protein